MYQFRTHTSYIDLFNDHTIWYQQKKEERKEIILMDSLVQLPISDGRFESKLFDSFKRSDSLW